MEFEGDITQEFLSPGGFIAKRSNFYEFRPQQIKMGEAVEESIIKRHHLLVEAGTGVGKSLAYLIPFIVWAVKSNKRVVISTYTKTLQEQLVQRDLPFLRKVFADYARHRKFSASEGDEGYCFNFALCVGGENYLCLRKLNRADIYELTDTEEEKERIEEIRQWAKKTSTGLYLDIPFRVPGNLWLRVCREADLCMGRKCTNQKRCFYRMARKREFVSQILVSNHHLFFANLASGGTVLPSFDAVVFDEAHTLEDVASNFLGVDVSNSQIKWMLDRLYNPNTDRGFILTLRSKKINDLKRLIDEVRVAQSALFAELISIFGEGTYSRRISKRICISHHFHMPVKNLAVALEEMKERVKDEEKAFELSAHIMRLKEIDRAIEVILTHRLDDYVYWIETNSTGRGAKITLHATPLNIAEILREELFAKVKPVILTSATLVTEKRFDYIKSRLGLDDCRELLLGSPFDYEQNTGLYIAEDLPDPNWQTEAYHHKVIERIKELLSITGGRTFILFTSFWMLNHTSDEIRGIPLSILRQGVLPRYLLLEEFKRSPDAVLLGTNTFWQGIDVPGAALQCIIIAKLPFTVPDDPVTEARMDVLKAQGKDPFIHYQIPQAIMMLRQGFGRLIRTKTDKGMVAILDPRIKTRFYGQRFLDSLPPCRRLHTLSEIEEYFSALAHQNSL